MEYGLGDGTLKVNLKDGTHVLILIVVEYGLGEFIEITKDAYGGVLILIVVEYGLGGVVTQPLAWACGSLNPYCSGIWSRRGMSKNEHLKC